MDGGIGGESGGDTGCSVGHIDIRFFLLAMENGKL